jgi:hypothetical protein
MSQRKVVDSDQYPIQYSTKVQSIIRNILSATDNSVRRSREGAKSPSSGF